jgi:hypothetical protein
MNQPQDLDKILEACLHFEKDESSNTNHDLHSIPVSEWKNYEELHLYVPEDIDKSSVSAACLWLEDYYGFKENGIAAYVTSDHHDNDSWHPSKDAPSGFYFVFGDTTDEDALAEKIYAQWKEEGLAARENYSRVDALILASKIICEQDIEKIRNEA